MSQEVSTSERPKIESGRGNHVSYSGLLMLISFLTCHRYFALDEFYAIGDDGRISSGRDIFAADVATQIGGSVAKQENFPQASKDQSENVVLASSENRST